MSKDKFIPPRVSFIECIPPFTHDTFTRTARFMSTYSPCTSKVKSNPSVCPCHPLATILCVSSQVASLRYGEEGQMAVTVQMQFESVVTSLSVPLINTGYGVFLNDPPETRTEEFVRQAGSC